MLRTISQKLGLVLAAFIGLWIVVGCNHPTNGNSDTGTSGRQTNTADEKQPVTPNSEKNGAGVFLGQNYDQVNGSYPYRYVFKASTDASKSLVNVSQSLYGSWYVLKTSEGEHSCTVVPSEFKKGCSSVHWYISDHQPSLSITPVGEEGASSDKVYRSSDLDVITVAKPGDWYVFLKDAPVTVLEHSISVDWSACRSGTTCAEWNHPVDGEVFNVESDGLILTNGVDSNYKLQLAK